jgi:Sulfotransferase domain
MMQTLEKFISENWKNLSDRSLRIKKNIYQFVKIRKSNDQKTMLFILGCQRSGTTLLTEIFERDFDNTKVYGEFSRLSSADKARHIRLNPLHLVKSQIDKDRPSLIILKPLVESQNALKLLDYFDNSKALWVYRHYGDVVLSHLAHWGVKNGINNLRPIIKGQSQNWRCENVSEETKEIVRKHFAEDMNPYDAAALSWFVRNTLFFAMNLDENHDVMTCKYEHLIDAPLQTMNNIYKFVGYVYPMDKITLHIYSGSKGRGKNIRLSRDIEILCNDMQSKLDSAHELNQMRVAQLPIHG